MNPTFTIEMNYFFYTSRSLTAVADYRHALHICNIHIQYTLLLPA